MRNYYAALGLQSNATTNEIREAIDDLSPEQLADEDDLQSVLLDDQQQMHYRRMHLQYEAIAAVIANPTMSDADNSHHWDKRVVEFEPVQNTIRL